MAHKLKKCEIITRNKVTLASGSICDSLAGIRHPLTINTHEAYRRDDSYFQELADSQGGLLKSLKKQKHLRHAHRYPHLPCGSLSLAMTQRNRA